MKNFFNHHVLSLNRFLENNLLLNTFYLIFLIIFLTTIIFIFIYNNKKKIPFLTDSKTIEKIIWLLPTIIIVILSYYTINTNLFLNQIKNFYVNLKPLILEIISMNWKWLIIFPTQKILVFNEFCLPIMIPIKIYLSSNSIMNTLCIPKYGSQLYCMVNSFKSINLIILKHGFCHGYSSNFSGVGNNFLRLSVFSLIKKNFFYWINKIKKTNLFVIKNYNILIKKGYFYNKFFKIRNNKIFISIIKKK